MPATNALLQEGRYRINNEFPSAGEGSLYEAYDTVSETTVLVKEIPVKLSRVSTSSQREDLNTAFANQVKVLTEIKHASFLGVRDYFSEIGRHYLVMESTEGDDLQTLLDRQKNCFPVSDATNWADQLLDALSCLHTCKTPIIHRNIRPSNIKLASDGKIKLMISEVAVGDSSASAGSTIAYSPLEQIWGGLDAASQKVITSKYDEQSERVLKEALDARSDVYSLGATLYHLVTARLPIDSLERSIEILDGRPDPLRAPHKVDPAIPPEISDVVMKALEIKREYRFDSAAIMRQVLKTAIVRVKEREAQELLEQEEAANDIKLAEQKKMEAVAEQLSETRLMKQKLKEAEEQRLLAEQRAAEAEKKLRESEAVRLSKIEQPVAAAHLEEDLLGVLSPSLHVSESPKSKAPSAAPFPIEVVEVAPKEFSPSQEPASNSLPTSVESAPGPGTTDRNGPVEARDEKLVAAKLPRKESLSGPANDMISSPATLSAEEKIEEIAAVDPSPFVESDWNEDSEGVNFLPTERSGSRFGVPVMAGSAAVIVMIAIGAWMFMSSGTPAPVKATTTEVPAAQPAQPDPAVTSAFKPDSAPANDQVPPSQSDSALTEPVSDPSTVRTAATASKPKKAPAKSPAAKKAVTADDLINDN